MSRKPLRTKLVGDFIESAKTLSDEEKKRRNRKGIGSNLTPKKKKRKK